MRKTDEVFTLSLISKYCLYSCMNVYMFIALITTTRTSFKNVEKTN